ncbi:MAG: DUF937 domain-containing protein [Thiolinea sp.]
MGILDVLLGSDNNDAIAQLAKQLGVSEDQARAVVKEVTPALTRGMQHNTKDETGVEGLITALRTGNHSRYIENPTVLGTQENINDGNSILGHIFGSKDVSRNVAEHASQETGIASSLIKKALPIVATMVMASLGKSLFSGTASASTGNQQQPSGGILSSLLDSDRDGSIIDDVLGMAFKMAFR